MRNWNINFSYVCLLCAVCTSMLYFPLVFRRWICLASPFVGKSTFHFWAECIHCFTWRTTWGVRVGGGSEWGNKPPQHRTNIYDIWKYWICFVFCSLVPLLRWVYVFLGVSHLPAHRHSVRRLVMQSINIPKILLFRTYANKWDFPFVRWLVLFVCLTNQAVMVSKQKAI